MLTLADGTSYRQLGARRQARGWQAARCRRRRALRRWEQGEGPLEPTVVDDAEVGAETERKERVRQEKKLELELEISRMRKRRKGRFMQTVSPEREPEPQPPMRHRPSRTADNPRRSAVERLPARHKVAKGGVGEGLDQLREAQAARKRRQRGDQSGGNLAAASAVGHATAATVKVDVAALPPRRTQGEGGGSHCASDASGGVPDVDRRSRAFDAWQPSATAIVAGAARPGAVVRAAGAITTAEAILYG